MSNFISEEPHIIHLSQIFNQEHAAMIFQQKLQAKPNFSTIHLHNVGIKIMRQAFEIFDEQPINCVRLEYNWNQIMMMPKLVCYDKNTWKTLQQLSNWNKQWSALFRPCYTIECVEAMITCSWADQNFIKAFLEGIACLPNIKEVRVCVKAKSEKVCDVLEAFQKANVFKSFQHQYIPY